MFLVYSNDIVYLSTVELKGGASYVVSYSTNVSASFKNRQNPQNKNENRRSPSDFRFWYLFSQKSAASAHLFYLS